MRGVSSIYIRLEINRFIYHFIPVSIHHSKCMLVIFPNKNIWNLSQSQRHSTNQRRKAVATMCPCINLGTAPKILYEI